MIDIADEISSRLVVESNRRKKYIFKDSSLTFKQLKQIFNDIFGTKIVSFSRKIPMKTLFVTNKDGEYVISSAGDPSNTLFVKDTNKILETEEEESSKEYLQAAIDKIIGQCRSSIDQKHLNRFFANGNNAAKFSIALVPALGDDCIDDKNGIDFSTFDGICCLDSNGKVVDCDKKATKEFQSIVGLDGMKTALDSNAMKRAVMKLRAQANVLEELTAALAKLADGNGWGCSIEDYVQDRYSRLIINKAIEHGIDIAKNGSFTRELCARLSKASSSIPTKSDLVTFAKREGVDCNSEEYKSFLSDIEDASSTINDDVIAPIQKIIAYAVMKAIDAVDGFAMLDCQNKPCCCMHRALDCGRDELPDSIESIVINEQTLPMLKRKTNALNKLVGNLPKSIPLAVNGKFFNAVGDFDKLNGLVDIMELR